jgi:capsular polysaccharide biosynthesis protein
MACELARAFSSEAPTSIPKLLPNALTISITEDPLQSPLSPNSRNSVKNSFWTFFITATILIAIILIANQFDTIIHDKKKIEDNLDIPIIGLIPRQSVSSKIGGSKDNVV